MNCPICNKETRVVDSRQSPSVDYVRRRRECLKCKHRFSTIEIPHNFETRGTKIPSFSSRAEDLLKQVCADYLKGLSSDELDRIYDDVLAGK